MIKACVLIFNLLIVFSVHAQSSCYESTHRYNLCKKSFSSKIGINKCFKAILQDYSGRLAWSMNSYLRGTRTDESCERYNKQLYKAVESLPKAAVSVFFRGVFLFSGLKKLKIDECFAESGYTSMSLDEEISKQFTNPLDSHILEINTQNGREFFKRSGYPEEKEVILLPGSFLQLKKIETNHHKMIVGGAELNALQHKYFFEEVSKASCTNL